MTLSFTEQYLEAQAELGKLDAILADLDTILILGSTKFAVSPTPTRVKSYSSLGAVAQDYNSDSQNNGANADPEYKIAKMILSQNSLSTTTSKLWIGQVLSQDGSSADSVAYVNALNAIIASGITFYGVLIASKDPSIQTAIAGAVETNKKYFWVSTNNTNILDANNTTDIGYILKNHGYKNSGVLYSSIGNTEYPEAAYLVCLLSVVLPFLAAYKQLQGVPLEVLTDQQKSALESKNANVYTTFGSGYAVLNGKTADGSWADIIALLAGR